MSKKVKLEITFEDGMCDINDVIHMMHSVLKGHAPYVENDIVLSTDAPYDGKSFNGDEIMLTADFTNDNIAKHGIMSDMLCGVMIPIVNAAKGEINNVSKEENSK